MIQISALDSTGTPVTLKTVDGSVAEPALAALANGNSYKNLTTAATTVIKGAAGVLDKVVVNTAGAGSALTLYDNASAGSGTKIGTISTAAQGAFPFNVAFANGLVAVTASGAAADITISYR